MDCERSLKMKIPKRCSEQFTRIMKRLSKLADFRQPIKDNEAIKTLFADYHSFIEKSNMYLGAS